VATGVYTRGLPVVVAGLAFVAWVALSATWSPSRVLASYTVTYLATFNLMCVAAGALVVARSRERVVRLLVLVTLFSLLLAVWGIASTSPTAPSGSRTSGRRRGGCT
jgi:hypothetical protein